MNKKIVVIIVLIALISLSFIFGILAVVEREKGHPPGIELGTSYSYWYSGMVFGSQVPASDSIFGQLYVIVSGYNPLLKQIELLTVNNWNNLTSSFSKQETVPISELVPTFPLFSERNSSLGGIAGQRSGEYFGWILPRDYPPGIWINNYFYETDEVKSLAAGTFATYVFTKANVTRDSNNLVTSSFTRLYFEQWSGVLVSSESIFSVYNASSGEVLFFEYEISMLSTFTSYKWPTMTMLMPILNFADPVIKFFSTYALFILIILLSTAIIILWKKSSSYK